MRLIDANALCDRITATFPAMSANAMYVAIEKAPTVDAVPVVYGEWLPTNDENKKRCSRCDVIHLIAQYPAVGANLCPACGAKMKKKVERREEREGITPECGRPVEYGD